MIYELRVYRVVQGRMAALLTRFEHAYVVSGQIVSQVEGQPEHVFRAGECWYETPGAHHLISRNASNTEPAKLLAVFVVDTEDNALTTPDHAGGSR
jgi:quercetin dioxygenase-like cupin family protein